MLTLKTKSLSFSRPTSPSRARSSAQPSPVVASTLTATEPVEDATLLSRKITPPPSTTTTTSSKHRSASSRRGSLKGTSLVALTPANPPPPPPAADDEVGGGASVQRRTTSQDRAFRPIRSLSASASHALAARSKSSDRVSDLGGALANGGGGGAVSSGGGGGGGKKLGGAGGLMASISKAGLRLAHSQSQPGTSRHHGPSAAAHHDESLLPSSPALSVGGGFPLSPGLGPSSSSAVASGAATPQTAVAAGAASSSSSTNIEQFAESFIAKVSLRLGEVVNRTFVPAPHGPGGAVDKQLELAEAPYGGNGVTWRGRPAPRLVKAKEFGERIAAELQAAHHDSYLLRTLLRSAILKALSLFLTRLSALLLVPSSTEPALHPSVFAAPRSLKEVDSMSLALKYNLHIVRCAYEVKRALSLVADPQVGVAFPPFVDETLKPWRAKLAELMNRVMGPLVQSARANIAETCLHARTVIKSECAVNCVQCHQASPSGGNSALGLHGLAAPAPVTHAGKVSATSQLRSLSLGRSASPAPSASSGVNGGATGHGHGHGHGSGGLAGQQQHTASAWARDLTSQFEAFGKVIGRLECGVDADKWIVTVATAAAWKGMLNLAARPVVAPFSSSTGRTPSVSGSSESSSVHSPAPEKPRRGLLLGGGAKKTPSPPQSPPLPANRDLATAAAAAGGDPAHAEVAFIRLLFDVESLEARLKAFLVSSLSTPAHVLAPAFASSVECPAASSSNGCGLCRTGRTFDDDSSDSEDDDDHAAVDGTGDPRLHRPGHESARESRLALSAMREAMQALSAMIVVVRASHRIQVLRDAVENRGAAVPTTTSSSITPGLEAPQPMTPSTLFARSGAPPAAIPPSTSMTAAKAPTVPAAPLQSSLATCPTLNSALLTMPPLVLLHVVAARVASPAVVAVADEEEKRARLALHLPHETWDLREGWVEYASELRGFAAGEEWAPEVAVELGAEAKRVLAARKELGVLHKADELALETLEVVARKTLH